MALLDDAHEFCVACLRVQHTLLALEGADCPRSENFTLRKLRSRLALFGCDGCLHLVVQVLLLLRQCGGSDRGDCRWSW